MALSNNQWFLVPQAVPSLTGLAQQQAIDFQWILALPKR